MSGGVLIRITLPQAPTGSPVPFDAQTVGFTTATADVVADLLGTGEALTYRKGYLTGGITTGNRMDISGGKGNFAEAIEGEFTIVDACPSGTISGQMQAGNILLRGAWVWIGHISSASIVSQGVQLKVADITIQDSGTIRVALKSQSYMLSNAMGASRTIKALVEDPGDPTLLVAEFVPTTFGISFGSRILSQKAGELPSATPIKWAGRNSSLLGNPSAAGTNCVTVTKMAHSYVPPTPGFKNTAGIELRFRSVAEAKRIVHLVNSLASSGEFSVIFSDGNWFLGANEFLIAEDQIQESGSVSDGTYYAWLHVTVYDSGLPKISDPSNPNIGIYVAQKNIPVCAGVADINGFSTGSDAQFEAPGFKSFSNGSTYYSPFMVTNDGFLASKIIKPNLGWVAGSFTDSTCSRIGAGAVENIRTDPKESPVSDPFAITGYRRSDVMTSTATDFGIEIQTNFDGDLEGFDSVSFGANVSFLIHSAVNQSCNLTVYAMGSGEKLLSRAGSILGNIPASQRAFDDGYSHPMWQSVYSSIQEMQDALHANKLRIRLDTFTTASAKVDLEIHVKDVFVRLYAKIKLSNSYLSIIPGYRPSECLSRSILYASGKWLISGDSNQYTSADGVSWTSQAAPDATGLLGLCNGAAGLVGFGTFSGGFASYLSTDGGANWNGTAQSFLGSFCVYDPANSRYIAVGGTLVGSGDGPAATRTSPDGVTWTTRTNSTTQANLYGVAVDGSGNVVAVGSNDGNPETALILTSADGGVTWTSRTSAVAGRLTSVVRSGSRWVACGFGGVMQTSADGITWTPRASGVTADLTNLATYGTRVIAVGSAGVVLVSTDSGLTWKAVDSTVTANLARVATSDGITWIASGASGMILQSLDSGASWFPQRCDTPQQAVATLRSQYIGGGSGWNHLTWSGFAGPAAAGKFGISFDPPDPENVDTSAVDNAVAKICQEWWGFAGETVGSIDGSTDPLAIALPNVFPGSLDDVATLLTVQYAPWAGSYLKKAYVQNVDVAYDSSKGDAYYFAGWDASGNTNGLAIWNACRNAYLSSGILRTRGFTLDSVHDEATLGALFLASDGDLGQRINWICGRPRYVELTALGNDSASARAYAGCRYTLNQTLIQARGLSLPTRGVVVDASHDHITGRHKITVGLLAAGVNFPILFLATVGAILQVWCLVSGGPGWAGCRVMQSWDGNTYTQVGTIASNNPTGYLSEDMARLMASPGRKAHPGMVAGGADILTADWSESSVEPPVPAWSDYLAGNPGALLWVDGEILGHAYQADQGGNVTRSNTLRRGLYGTQPRPHIEGARVGAMTATSFRWDVPSGHSGQTCYFRFPSLAGDNGVTGTYSVVIA